MKSVLGLLCLLFSAVSAFQLAGPVVHPSVRPMTTTNTTVSALYAVKKDLTAKEKAEIYWQGEWVCKDCGYIYNRVSGLYYWNALPESVTSTFGFSRFLVFPPVVQFLRIASFYQ
jgi:hypothetical protein